MPNLNDASRTAIKTFGTIDNKDLNSGKTPLVALLPRWKDGQEAALRESMEFMRKQGVDVPQTLPERPEELKGRKSKEDKAAVVSPFNTEIYSKWTSQLGADFLSAGWQSGAGLNVSLLLQILEIRKLIIMNQCLTILFTPFSARGAFDKMMALCVKKEWKSPSALSKYIYGVDGAFLEQLFTECLEAVMYCTLIVI